MKIWLSICFSLLSLLFSSFSFAETKANTGIASLAAGYEYFAPKRNLQNTGLGLAVLGFNFTQHWGVEGLVGLLTTLSRRNADYGQHINGKLYAFDGVYRFLAFHHLEPFVLAGVGVTSLSDAGTSANNEGNINAGVGTHIFINEVVAFRFEARDFYTMTGGKNDFMVDAGISARLG